MHSSACLFWAARTLKLNPPESFFSSRSDHVPVASLRYTASHINKWPAVSPERSEWYTAVAQTFHSERTFKQLKLRQQLETYTRDGILTVWSIAYAFRPRLRVASPWDECRCPGNLEFSADRVFTCLFATHANILTSSYSTPPRGVRFSATGTLLYRANAKHWHSCLRCIV